MVRAKDWEGCMISGAYCCLEIELRLGACNVYVNVYVRIRHSNTRVGIRTVL